jgi:hypothetical protein
MFFEKEYEYTIIEDVTFNELEKRNGIQERTHPTQSNPERWSYYSYLKAKENGLNDIYAVNFGYTISSFIAGLGIDAGTDIYFQQGIDDAIFDIYEKLYSTSQNESWSEQKLVTEFFHTVLLFYKSGDGARKYEKAIYGHNIRLSTEIKDWFLQQNQSSKKTLVELMNKTILPPHMGIHAKDENVTFQFTFSEENMWNQLPGETDSEKLEGLLL